MDKYDFSGWATRTNLRCSDGRTIMKDAFKGCDGKTVPLVWNHQHDDPSRVLGHAVLENRNDGVYAYCTFNNTPKGRDSKLLVEHGDISALSIYANQLQQNGGSVVHGAIREVSLVLAGANPGAFIDAVLKHGEMVEDEAIIYTGENLSLFDDEESPVKEEKPEEEIKHADETANKEVKKMAEPEKKAVEPADGEETVADVFDTLTDKQKTVVYAMIGHALEDNNKPYEEGEDDMKHNVFDQDNQENQDDVLSHSDMEAVFSDARRYGSLKDSALAHGITNIDYLFPDAKTMETAPGFITREQTWVTKLMNGVHHTPFSRIKSMFANLTEAEARAKGYIKGNEKTEEVFSLLKRTTTPTTIYKKQKLDRDDVIDITDFDVVAWLKTEMRMMLDEEIARAILVGDGRLSSSDDKINEANIRPVWTDADLYTIKKTITVAANATDDQKAKAFIRAAIKSRKDYKGSGNPTMWTTEDMLTDCLLMEDTTGRVIYETAEKLAIALRVKEIVTVAVMDNLTRTVDGDTRTLLGIIMNPDDYNVGADKGGAVNMFDDFDIDYNQQKYLIETRCSGALTKPYSAIALELDFQ